MLPVLRSIDVLLNRFDQLSQRHSELSSKFDTNLIDIANPLKDVAREAEEQRQTVENLSQISHETLEYGSSIDNSETFNRLITKSRHGNRPPNYSSNDSFFNPNRVPSRSSWVTTESSPSNDPSSLIYQPSRKQTSNSAPTSRVTFDENSRSRDRFITRSKIRISQPMLSPPRRQNRTPITAFTMETVNRLSKPRSCYASSETHTFLRKSSHRSKLVLPARKDPSASSCSTILTSTTLSQTKRTSPIPMKLQSKKPRTESKEPVSNSKKSTGTAYPRAMIDFAPPPKIQLGFPTRNEIQSSRVIVFPPNMKSVQTKPPVPAFSSNRRMLLLSQNRMMHLMT